MSSAVKQNKVNTLDSFGKELNSVPVSWSIFCFLIGYGLAFLHYEYGSAKTLICHQGANWELTHLTQVKSADLPLGLSAYCPSWQQAHAAASWLLCRRTCEAGDSFNLFLLGAALKSCSSLMSCRIDPWRAWCRQKNCRLLSTLKLCSYFSLVLSSNYIRPPFYQHLGDQ